VVLVVVAVVVVAADAAAVGDAGVSVSEERRASLSGVKTEWVNAWTAGRWDGVVGVVVSTVFTMIVSVLSSDGATEKNGAG